jgi:hypothetical protein
LGVLPGLPDRSAEGFECCSLLRTFLSSPRDLIESHD